MSWKLLNQDEFRDIRFTLDNIMKQRCAKGIGLEVKKAQVLTLFDEEIFWSMGLLGAHDPDTLLNTLVYLLGKGFALHAGNEHRSLKSPQFSSMITFMHDENGSVFVRYSEQPGIKTYKGGLKHRKVEPKCVDIYAIADTDRCPVRILLKYLSKLPVGCRCEALYLKPVRKYRPNKWYYDTPVGANTLRNCCQRDC